MSAAGDDPKVHRIVDERFVCTALPDAKCRTYPTGSCEQWCGCDGSPEDAADNHDEGEHCCSTTRKDGQACWLEPWINADLSDCYSTEWPVYGMAFPDGPVTCDWEDEYVTWKYADDTVPVLEDDAAEVPA